MSIIERMRKKTLPNPYEIKKEDVGSLLTSRTGDFGEVISADVGKRVYLRNGILQMENTEQVEKRKGRGWHGDSPGHRKAALKAERKGAINEPIRTKQKMGEEIGGLRIIQRATGKERLKANEWFALMVTDEYHKYSRPKEDYINFEKGWLGWERPTRGKPYISKNYLRRHDPYRGDTFVVQADEKDGYILTEV